jgi:hypothetical protein
MSHAPRKRDFHTPRIVQVKNRLIDLRTGQIVGIVPPQKSKVKPPKP